MGRLRKRKINGIREHEGVQSLHPIVQHQHEPLGGAICLQAA